MRFKNVIFYLTLLFSLNKEVVNAKRSVAPGFKYLGYSLNMIHQFSIEKGTKDWNIPIFH